MVIDSEVLELPVLVLFFFSFLVFGSDVSLAFASDHVAFFGVVAYAVSAWASSFDSLHDSPHTCFFVE